MSRLARRARATKLDGRGGCWGERVGSPSPLPWDSESRMEGGDACSDGERRSRSRCSSAFIDKY